jgi:hypothetical protein
MLGADPNTRSLNEHARKISYLIKRVDLLEEEIKSISNSMNKDEKKEDIDNATTEEKYLNNLDQEIWNFSEDVQKTIFKENNNRCIYRDKELRRCNVVTNLTIHQILPIDPDVYGGLNKKILKDLVNTSNFTYRSRCIWWFKQENIKGSC